MEALPEEPPQRPAIAQAPLSVLLLAVGSTSAVVEAVAGWQSYLATLARPVELLLVPLVPLEGNAALTDVRWLDVDPSVGYGPALQRAFSAAQYPLVALATADAQCRPADLDVLFKVIDKVDLAVGCRTVARRPWWWRAVSVSLMRLGWILAGLPVLDEHCTPGATPWQRRWAARWLFGVRLTDPESPFRLARREAMTRIVLQSRGRFALVEQLAKANQLEMIMAEEPVAWTPPATPMPEFATFGAEARTLFRQPDFGPPELHVLPEGIAAPAPTTAPAESSEH